MRGRGINYDTGFVSAGVTTHEPFDPHIVEREMRIIHDDLHCNAVRITGGIPERLEVAAAHAAAAGLEVWFCPFTHNLTAGELLDLLADCAHRAERLRQRGAEIVFLTGSELSLFTIGFFPGDNLEQRVALLSDPLRLRELIPGIRAAMKDLLAKALAVVRPIFGGRVSYASIPFEAVDWAPFDIISTDAGYRTAAMAAGFRDNIRAFVSQGKAQGKPVAITEFGCGAHRGAADTACRTDIIEWGPGARPVGLKGEFARDEAEQARYIGELLDVFETEGVDNAFVYTFARYDLVHRSAPHEDFDMASAGVVKVFDDEHRGQRYPDMPWEPKLAFDAPAGFYRAPGS